MSINSGDRPRLIWVGVVDTNEAKRDRRARGFPQRAVSEPAPKDAGGPLVNESKDSLEIPETPESPLTICGVRRTILAMMVVLPFICVDVGNDWKILAPYGVSIAGDRVLEVG